MINCLCVGVLVLFSSISQAGEPTELETQAKNILINNCIFCHGGGEVNSEFDLSTRQHLLHGGVSGKVVVPGDADNSFLIKLIEHQNQPYMPHELPKLSDEEIQLLRDWIDAGVPYDEPIIDKPFKYPSASKEPLWSLQSITEPKVPQVKSDWIRTPIDAFILAKLEEHDLQSSPEADKQTLLRRLKFVLHGLPPTTEELYTFLHDDSDDAYEKLVDRLLASPRFGERWGRHWLDIAHYADTYGYGRDLRRPNAWRYRDYVIQAFNDDKPYNKFIREQIAGDAIEKNDPDAIAATGFLVTGPWDQEAVDSSSGQIKRKFRSDVLDDMITTVMTSTVAMTINCARCHDHKFDPITQEDYYQLSAVFAGSQHGNRSINSWPDEKLENLLHPAESGQPDKDIDRGTDSSVQYAYAVIPIEPQAIHLLRRGDPESPGKEVNPGTFDFFDSLPSEFGGPDMPEAKRREALADWIVHPGNSLTRRVIVNRIWHYLFGKGIVDTPSDFGHNGSKPTHSELLDWLAVDFSRHNWSIKACIKQIVMSSVFRQSSANRATAAKIDADNRLLWRMNQRRMEAEVVRDSILAIGGHLNLKMGGPGYEPFDYIDKFAPDYIYRTQDDPSVWRRTVYRFNPRSVPDPFLEVLDCPNPNNQTPVRNQTNTPLQPLTLMNDEYVLKQADYLAERLLIRCGNDVKRQIEDAFELFFAREATQREIELSQAFIEKHGTMQFCRMLYNANEFVYID